MFNRKEIWSSTGIDFKHVVHSPSNKYRGFGACSQGLDPHPTRIGHLKYKCLFKRVSDRIGLANLNIESNELTLGMIS